MVSLGLQERANWVPQAIEDRPVPLECHQIQVQQVLSALHQQFLVQLGLLAVWVLLRQFLVQRGPLAVWALHQQVLVQQARLAV